MCLLINVPRWIREIPEHHKTQEMCDEAVEIELCSLAFVPDRFKTRYVQRGSGQERIHTRICS